MRGPWCWVLLLVALPAVAQACSCIGFRPGPVLYQTSQAVFAGTLTSIETDNGPRVAEFFELRVSEIFKGAPLPQKVRAVVFLSSCGGPPVAGQEMLIYSTYDANLKAWRYSPGCGGGVVEMRHAAEDLLFLRTTRRDHVASLNRLSGHIAGGGDYSAGITVVIRDLTPGGAAHRVRTGNNGEFELYDLIPASYQVSLEDVPPRKEVWFTVVGDRPESRNNGHAKSEPVVRMNAASIVSVVFFLKDSP